MEYAGKLAIRDTGDIRNFIFSEPAKKHQEFIKKICGIDAEERSAAISSKRFYLSEASENRRVFERLFIICRMDGRMYDRGCTFYTG